MPVAIHKLCPGFRVLLADYSRMGTILELNVRSMLDCHARNQPNMPNVHADDNVVLGISCAASTLSCVGVLVPVSRHSILASGLIAECARNWVSRGIQIVAVYAHKQAVGIRNLLRLPAGYSVIHISNH